MPVTRGFQIEEILSQDDRGVVFEALETATGRRVLLTRFFPAGTAGGGFPEAARRRFEECVAVLRDVAHPGLRGVVGGGCDPADGIRTSPPSGSTDGRWRMCWAGTCWPRMTRAECWPGRSRSPD